MVEFSKIISGKWRSGLVLLFVILVLGVAFSIIYGGNLKQTKIFIGDRFIYADVAETPESRSQGLSFRRSLGVNEGMLFIFDTLGNYGFWMKDMNFPIDIVWIKGNEVIGVEENIAPQPGKSLYELPIYYPPGMIDKVLEVSAGRAKTLGLSSGSVIKIR